MGGGYLLAALLLMVLFCRTILSEETAAPGEVHLSPACRRLDETFSSTNASSVPWRSVSVHGRERTLLVYTDGRAPSRAAAALLVALLRHAARYKRVQLAHAPPSPRLPHQTDYCSLAEHVHRGCVKRETSSSSYDYLTVSPDINWSMSSSCSSLEYCEGYRDSWVVEPGLKAEGANTWSPAPTLHVHLAARARSPLCNGAVYWDFYTDTNKFQQCAFTQFDTHELPAVVYTLVKNKNVTDELMRRIAALALYLTVAPLEQLARPRTTLQQMLDERNASFLFLDYDLWTDKEGVQIIRSEASDTDLIPEEPVVSVRVADEFPLRNIAPAILKTLQQFTPSPTYLRQILEREERDPESVIEDAACEWAINNVDKFTPFHLNFKRQHWITVFLCGNDPDKEEYKKVANIVITENINVADMDVKIEKYFVEIDCTNEEELNNEYLKTFLSHRWQKLIGVVAAGSGMRVASENEGLHVAQVFYDVPAPRVRLGGNARAAAGTVHHLAIAILHFLDTFKWKRLVSLTENTDLAKGLIDELDQKILLHNTLLTDFTSAHILTRLKILQSKQARIVFINTNATIAETIICQAYEQGMTNPAKYAWLLRERRAIQLKCNNVSVEIEHFTISFWWRGGDDSHLVHIKDGLDKTIPSVRRKLHESWGNSSWPTLAAPLADALQLLMKNFKQFIKSYPDKFYDLHGRGTAKLLLNSHNTSINGIVQQFENCSISNPLIFVDRWKKDRHEPLLQWRIQNERVQLVAQLQQHIYGENIPTDGSSFCLIPKGDKFFPHCKDPVLYGAFGFVIIVGLALYLAIRVRFKWLARRDALLTAQLLAQREHVSNALVNHYVDRAALELYHELGHGCYGRVRYGLLRAPDRPPVSVAVKESHEDVSPAEESELLREACTIASLRHDHVVRLIGVCTTGGPLLVLMEFAFFGDLRGYLCQRRHLAARMTEEHFDEFDERYHVSAVSLTRLAKEAASALEYLAIERLVHRDVRACNCLIDGRRSLKLADFGLARSTGAGVGATGEAEYACRRRGLFPVLWMAPESLERGVFTAASDAWALGVLLLELVTLGARPYGTWPPLRVMRYVTAGGRPPFPPDASPDTQRILAQCWSSTPEERLTAGALVALLEAAPEALSPALEPVEPPADEECPAINIAPELV